MHRSVVAGVAAGVVVTSYPLMAQERATDQWFFEPVDDQTVRVDWLRTAVPR